MRDRPYGRRGEGQPDPRPAGRQGGEGRRPAPSRSQLSAPPATFDEALAYLDAHIDVEKSKAVAGEITGLTLGPIERLVDVLGDPHLAAPVLHLTGTNGKGSTARMLSVLLRANGVLTGTYSSPHLEAITERIAIAGESIPPDDFARVIGELAALEPLTGVQPSYFELLTAAAFAFFAEQAVEAAIVEVGLLGRFDATNVVHADVAVITNIGRDHTDGAGDWRQRIATEKAGIIEADSHVVCGETDPDLVEIIVSEGGRDHWIRDRDFGVEQAPLAVGGRLVTLRTPYAGRTEVHLPVHGLHQADNAAVALAAAEAFFGRAIQSEIVQAAFAQLTLPGRFEVVSRAPLTVIDAGHNADGVAETVRTLEAEFTVTGETVGIVGLLAGRDPGSIVDHLAAGGVDRLVAVRPDSPRAFDPGDLVSLATAAGLRAERTDDPVEAFRRVLDAASDDDAVLVTGSFYSSGAIRTAARELGLID